MDFEFPADAEAFRADLRDFIKREIPPWWSNHLHDDDRSFPFTVEFCKKLATKGWLVMAWPEEYGGAGADVWHQNIMREEMWAMGEPRGWQYMNLNFIGPSIMMFGTDEQKERYLPPMAAGEAVWCQGFTEPNAGSDLAGLQTRADDTGNGYKINGHKTWVTNAFHSEHCILLARTDPNVPKHKGISMFLVDMNTPGITVCETPTMAGQTKVHELFFEDAEVPYGALLGPLNQGWQVAMTALERERIGLGYSGRNQIQLDQLLRFVKETKDSTGRLLSERPDVRKKLTRLRALNRALRLLMNKVSSDPSDDGSGLIDAAAFKVLAGDSTIETAELAVELAGQRGLLLEDDPMATLGDGAFMWWVYALPVQVAAGPSEIQRNIIAQRELGLPRG